MLLNMGSRETIALLTSGLLHAAVILAIVVPKLQTRVPLPPTIMDLDILLPKGKRSPSKTRAAPSVATRETGPKAAPVEAAENGRDIQVAEQDRYILEIHQAIQSRKSYPAQSRRLGEEGRVVVAFMVDRAGAVSEIQLKSPSPFPRLDSAALEIVRSVGRFRPFPPVLKEAYLRLEIPIEYVMGRSF